MSGRFASGNIALLHQPGDLRSFIQLSRYLYPFCIKELRRRLENDRSGVEVVEVWAPVDAPRIAVALDRRTLYLFGLRALPGGEWWCFEGYPRPTDPPGAKVRLMSGDGNYASFGWPERISTTPIKLLTDLSYLLIPGVGRGSPGGIDEALDVTTGFLIQARDGPAP